MAVADIAIRIVTKGAELAKRQVDGLSNSAGKSGKMLQTFAKAGAVAGVAIGTVLAKALASGAREFIDFQDAMTQSVAIMKTTEEQNQRMADSAREVAITTRISAKDSADAFFFLASAGLDAEQSISALPQVAKFAQAGMFDMATATDLATDAQSALGMTVSDAEENLENLTRVTDVLVKANTLANASVQQFSEALTNKAGSALKVANKGIEEGVAVLSAFADRGVKGAEAGEKLNQLLRDIPRATAKNGEEFAKLNLAMFDAEGNMKNVADIIEELDRVLAPMSDELKASTLDQLGLNRGVADAVKILSGASDQIRTYQDALEDSGGMTQQVADNQMKSLQAEIDVVKDKFIEVRMAMIEQYEPAMRDVIKVTGMFLDLISGRGTTDIESFAKSVDFFTKILGFLNPALRQTPSMVDALTSAMEKQTRLNMGNTYVDIDKELQNFKMTTKDAERNSHRLEVELAMQQGTIENLSDSYEDTTDSLEDLTNEMANNQFDALMKMISAEEAYNDIFKENKKLLDERNKRLGQQTDAEKALEVAEKNLAQATETANELAKDGTEISNEESLAIARQKQRIEELTEVEDKNEIQKLELLVAGERLIELEERAKQQSDKAKDAKRAEERALEDVRRAQNDLARAVESAEEAQKEYNEATAKTPANLAEIASAHKEMMDAINDVKAFDGFKLGLEKFAEGTGETLSAVYDQIMSVMNLLGADTKTTGGTTPPNFDSGSKTFKPDGTEDLDKDLEKVLITNNGRSGVSAVTSNNGVVITQNIMVEGKEANAQALDIIDAMNRAKRNGQRVIF